MNDQWELLVKTTSEKSYRLKEANRQKSFMAAVKDLEFWLGEVEGTISCTIIFLQFVSEIVKKRFKTVKKKKVLLYRYSELFFKGLLASEDYGKDLASIENLMKKHQLLEADITAHADRVNDMNTEADNLLENEQFDQPEINNRRKVYLQSGKLAYS